jgi:hypothetical protein
LTSVTATVTGVNKDDSELPQDLTTFKLSLGEQEKQARSQLVLPYLRYVVSVSDIYTMYICDLTNTLTAEPKV